MSLSGAVLWGLLAIAALLLLAALTWWLRTQHSTAMRSFYSALRQMEHNQAVSNRYELPWLLMLGDEQQSAQHCTSWKLAPMAMHGWFGRWWADPDGAVLVVPDALFVPEEGATAQRAAWRRLLGYIQRLRSQRPLDGVLWTIPASRLSNNEQALAYGLAARHKFIDLLQQLGLSLPVYVLVTEMETVTGFHAFLAATPPEQRDCVLGWATPFELDAAWQPQWSDTALQYVSRSVSEAVIELGALSGQLSKELYQLPEQFDAMRTNLQVVLDPVFQGNALGEAPRFRGLYFTASEARCEVDAWSARPSRFSLFTQRLWHTRIIAEQGLAKAVPRILRVRRRSHQLLGISAMIVAVFWLAAMIWVWRDAVSDAARLASLAQRTQERYVQVDDEPRRRELIEQNVQTLWDLLQQSPRWRYRSLVLPSSWFSSLDSDLADFIRTSALNQLYLPLHDLLVVDYQNLTHIQLNSHSSEYDTPDPEQWPNYLKARTLVTDALRVERENQLFANALGEQMAPLDALIQMSNSAFTSNFNVGTLRQHAYYNRVLSAPLQIPLQPIDLQKKRGQIRAQFQQLMQLWLEQYMLGNSFVRPAGFLRTHLDKLRSGYGNSLPELESVTGLIADLQRVIALANTAWSHSSGRDLVPSYRSLLNDARESQLLGASVEQTVDKQALRLQKTFRGQWVAQPGMEDNLMEQQSTGLLALQSTVLSLDKAINSLLKYDFSALAVNQADAQGHTQMVDRDGLGAALNYLKSYESYASQELAQIPPAFRAAMLGAAQNAAATAIWYSLQSRANLPRLSENQAFDVPADKALLLQKAFVELKRPDLSERLQQTLNQRALADLERAQNEVNTLPLFSQVTTIADWSGVKSLGLELFHSVDTQDLKQSLAQQFAVMQKTTEAHLPALEWLRLHKENLSISDYDKVASLQALYEQMLKYKEQNPSSSPAQIEQLLSRDFVDMDSQTCITSLRSAVVTVGVDAISRRAQELLSQAQQRCEQLQQEQGALAWNALTGHFNQYLANRFPFSYDLTASDADPERVRSMLELIDSHLAQAKRGIADSHSPDKLAAADFLERLEQTRAWLAPLLMRDKDGVLGLDIDVLWRTDRNNERGADQVIAWSLQMGSQEINYPSDEQTRLHWTVGEPISLRLRWAKSGPQRPVNDPLQPSLAVNDLEASWEYEGPWALLRLMRAHVSVQRQQNVDYTQFPLALRLPVSAPYSTATDAQMFVHLSLLTKGGKLPLSVHPLPVRAPQSPFSGASLLTTQEAP